MIGIIISAGLANWFSARSVWTVMLNRPGQVENLLLTVLFTYITWRLIFP